MNHSSTIAISNKQPEFIVQAVRGSWLVLILAIIYQLIFFAEITNIIALTAVVFAWLVTTKIWLQREMLEKYLFSAFIILGYTSSQFYFPLLFTSIENKPLIYNLELPEEVFLHATAGLVVLIASHALYRFLVRVSPGRSGSILGNAGFFNPPTYLQLWVMGFLGMASSFYVHFASPEIGQAVTGSPGDKIVQALVPFMYAPFFVPLGKLFGNNDKPHRGYLLMIALYSILLFAISIARNSRGAFIFGLTTPAFAYVLGLLLGVFKTKILTVRNFVIGGSIVWLLIGPLADLGVAMVIVRGGMQDVPPAELILRTIQTLDDKEAIERRREDDIGGSIDPDWDERYLDNLFTARFSNIKFNDSNLITYSKIGSYDSDMQEYSLDRLIAALPDPVIKMFDLDVDKEGTLQLSFGDYQYVVSGGFGTPAGLRTGHFAGSGLATFGWWYLLIYGVILLPIFYLNDRFVRARKRSELPVNESQTPNTKVSFCGILSLTLFFQFLTFESVVDGATFLLREWPQMVLLYFFIYHASRIICLPLTRQRRKLRLIPS